MARRSIIGVMEDILVLLSKGGEYSVKAISEKVGSQWSTTQKSLEFLERHGLVKQRKGATSFKTERLFRLASW